MPYIKSDDGRREALQRGEPALTAGELNYQIFYHVKHFDNTMPLIDLVDVLVIRFLGEKPNYQRYNDMTGALIRCYKELKRRLGIDVKDLFIEIMESFDGIIDAYEDVKCSENGDVE